METSHIATKSGIEYDHLFPRVSGEVVTIKKLARLEDTVKFLPEAIAKTLYQTKLIAPELIRATAYETCKSVWNFAFDHISYRKDELGKEQIQSPGYTWAVRKGDCDDYTVLIVSIMSHIKGMKLISRIAAYNEENSYQHIYPVVILSDGMEIIMDCVAKKFDYEVPYIYKKDKKMELQFLNGLEGTRTTTSKLGIDADDLLEGYGDVWDLGKLNLKSKTSEGGSGGKLKNAVKKIQDTKIAKTVRKGLHLTNKINPAAALLRTGILIALKTNLFKIAERLRFSYLSPQQVTERGMDMNKYNRLIGVRDQLEKIFFRAGGELKNFKKEILTGKGNRDKQVPLSGLGALDTNEYDQYNSVAQILGIETYNSEMNTVEGLGDLGEAITAGAAVTAATGALTAIAALLKSIGDLRKKPGKESTEKSTATEQGEESAQTSESTITQNPINTGANPNDSFFKDSTDTSFTSKSNGSGVENKSSNADTPATTSKSDDANGSGTSNPEVSTNSTSEESASAQNGGGNENSESARSAQRTPSTTTKEKEGFLTKAGNWIKAHPVQTAVGVVVIGAGVYALVKYLGNDGNDNKKGKVALGELPHQKKKIAYRPGRIKTYRLK